MSQRSIEASPQIYARTGGFLYLVIIIVGLWGEAFVRSRLIVANDAAKTAANILTHESLWRAHIAGELVLLVCGVGLLTIEYLLLRPISREISLLAMIFGIMSITTEAAITMYLIQPLFPLGSDPYLNVFTPQQLDTLARLSLRAHGYGFGLSLVFFGCFCIVVGYLIFNSNYLPKFVGMFMAIAGVCYLINSFALILSPGLADLLFPFILIPSFIGELTLCLWLLIMGVNVRKWKQRVAA
jgi:Domain of unknown function (DUF4386)